MKYFFIVALLCLSVFSFSKPQPFFKKKFAKVLISHCVNNYDDMLEEYEYNIQNLPATAFSIETFKTKENEAHMNPVTGAFEYCYTIRYTTP